jgi:rhodanese-related sulfurtransferase
VREHHEWRAGHARGARHLSGGAEIHVICASGHRSQVVARLLWHAGCEMVASVRGGTAGWRRAELPIDR